MPIEMRHLRAFVAVAEDLNFRKAAARLHTAQPALSRTILDAELILGLRLFDRSTRVVRLTPAAAAFLPEARDILERLEISIRTAQRTARGELGTLHIGYNDFAIPGLLPTILMDFRTRYPEINVALKMMTSPQMAEMIRSRSLDIGFLTGAHLVGDLASATLLDERLVCVLPRGHRLAGHAAVDVRDLADEAFVMGARTGWDIFLEVVDRFCGAAGFRPRIVQEADYSNGIVGLVAAGFGLSIYVERSWLYARDDIAVRPFTARTPPVATVAAWHPELRSTVVSNFVRTIEGAVRPAAA